ncbi:DNA polymerase III subunit delta [Thermoactinomyces mirandus]|uniref:DNA polymerase III subunit delta n=1 Tax=Thermoactinomyces mirandus TaxID=2756294 RepID=A0A7W1XPE8_9BACL|nr:DNA polymerase III subunit delta [Thermoactinomyces mirandus]MBA4600781.1 DNA polymerase III subunit delta [Thermoactinomyces mirandus]
MDQSLQKLKKGERYPFYFFFGTESFLIEETVRWMKKKWMPSDDPFGNFVSLDLEETPVQTLVQEAETLPFFGDRRFIVGNHAQFLTSKKTQTGLKHDLDSLLKYLEDPLSSSIVVITVNSEQLDKRKKVVKALLKKACTIEFSPLKGKKLMQWVDRRFKQLDVHIDTAALKEFILLVGSDLQLLNQECMKLAAYAGKEGTVTAEAVSMLVPRTLEHDVFKLTEKIAERQIGQAFMIWQDLLFQKEEPVRILALIVRQFRLMLQVKTLAKKGMSDKEMARFLKVHPYPVKLALRHGARFSESQLCQLLMSAILADQEIKSGKMDKVLAVERLLLSIHQAFV